MVQKSADLGNEPQVGALSYSNGHKRGKPPIPLLFDGLLHDPVELAVELGVALHVQAVRKDAAGHHVEWLAKG